MSVNVNSPLPAGRRIHDRYVINGYLGGGANGRVYEVFDEHQKQTVALKLLTKFNLTAPWREAEVLTGMRGEYVLSVLNADTEAGVPFIVTEVLTNGSLEARITAGIGVEVGLAARWTQQAATGVSRLHDRNLLHNDIKPENIFIADNGDALIGDLGLACLMDTHGYGAFGGTPETMAPEVARGGFASRPSSVRSDVYSLGASLHWLLAGHPLNPNLGPLAGNVPALLHEVATHVPVQLYTVAPHIPVGLSHIVGKAVDPDPAERFATAADFAAAIGARTRPTRTWQRMPACTGHTTCFEGAKVGAVTLKMCAVPTGQRTRHQIEIRRQSTGHRVGTPWASCTRAELSARLRSAMNRYP